MYSVPIATVKIGCRHLLGGQSPDMIRTVPTVYRHGHEISIIRGREASRAYMSIVNDAESSYSRLVFSVSRTVYSTRTVYAALAVPRERRDLQARGQR